MLSASKPVLAFFYHLYTCGWQLSCLRWRLIRHDHKLHIFIPSCVCSSVCSQYIALLTRAKVYLRKKIKDHPFLCEAFVSFRYNFQFTRRAVACGRRRPGRVRLEVLVWSLTGENAEKTAIIRMWKHIWANLPYFQRWNQNSVHLHLLPDSPRNKQRINYVVNINLDNPWRKGGFPRCRDALAPWLDSLRDAPRQPLPNDLTVNPSALVGKSSRLAIDLLAGL